MASLSLKNISKVFPNGFIAVKDFSMDIADGEFVVFVGPSGCGKSTILRMIAGLEDITSGELYIGDCLVNDMEPQDRDVAMIFQNYVLYPNMSVYDNMAFGLKMRNMPRAEIDRVIHEMAGILDIESILDRKPKSLTGAQRQRVVMGRAMVRNPKVTLLDEPLMNLDEKLRRQMREETKKVQEKTKDTIIYVTDDQTEAMTLGSRIVVMNDGVVQQIGTPEELYEKPVNKFVAGYMGTPQMNLFDARVEQEGKQAVLCFCERRVLLNEERSVPLLEGGYVGKEIFCGVRPEDIHTDEAFITANPQNTVEAVVQVYEMLGAEVFLHFQVADIGFITRTGTESEARPGDVIRVCLDTKRVHLFDKATERTISNQ